MPPMTAPETAFRAAVFRRTEQNSDRTVELSFASDALVSRYFGLEELKISADAIRLDRIRTEGPLLLHHDSNQLAGKVEDVWIDGNKVRALVRFGTSNLAEEAYQDVLNGIRTGVSFGYVVHAVEDISAPGDGERKFLVTDWEPIEITLEPIPADITVGTTRGLQLNSKEGTTMDKNKETSRSQGGHEHNEDQARHILELGEKFNQRDLANQYAREGRTEAEFQAALLKRMETPATLDDMPTRAAVPQDELGLSQADRERYSVVRAIRYLTDPGSARVANEAGHELEVSRAYASRVGRSPEGIFIPHETLFSRDITKAGTGSNLIANDFLASDFVGALRAKSVAMQLGRKLTGLRGDVTIPRQTGAGAASWVDEEGSAPSTTQVFDKIELSPKSLAAYTYLSRKMLIQSTPTVDALVQADLAEAVALGIDAAAVNGSGSGSEPLGILNNPDVAVVEGGTDGALMEWSHVVGLESLVWAANADAMNMAYLVTPGLRGHLKTTEKASGTAKFCWEDLAAVGQDGKVKAAGYLNGHAAYATNQVPSDLVKGTSSDCHAAIFGDFQQLLVALWGALDVNVDRASAALKGGVRIVVFQDADIALRQPAAFAVMKDAVL